MAKDVLETEHRSPREYEPEINELETQSVPRLGEVKERRRQVHAHVPENGQGSREPSAGGVRHDGRFSTHKEFSERLVGMHSKAKVVICDRHPVKPGEVDKKFNAGKGIHLPDVRAVDGRDRCWLLSHSLVSQKRSP